MHGNEPNIMVKAMMMISAKFIGAGSYNFITIMIITMIAHDHYGREYGDDGDYGDDGEVVMIVMMVRW